MTRAEFDKLSAKEQINFLENLGLAVELDNEGQVILYTGIYKKSGRYYLDYPGAPEE